MKLDYQLNRWRPALLTLTAVALLGSLNQMHAHEHGAAVGASDHEYHKNHGATFLGATTHLHDDDTGFTIGTEYTRRWGLLGVGLVVEMYSSRIERDIRVGIPLSLYPWRGLILFAAPAAEVASKIVGDGVETVYETELEPLFRFGTGYWFALNETIAVARPWYTDSRLVLDGEGFGSR
jgi:hypothetical protein